MKIVAVTGNGPPFPRFVDAVTQLSQSRPNLRIWLQWGNSSPPPAESREHLAGANLVPRVLLLEHLRAAAAVIVHGGSGTLLDALQCGHLPLVMARRAHLNEHVNDHQLELLEALGKTGRILPCHYPSDLLQHIDTAIAARTANRQRDAGANDGVKTSDGSAPSTGASIAGSPQGSSRDAVPRGALSDAIRQTLVNAPQPVPWRARAARWPLHVIAWPFRLRAVERVAPPTSTGAALTASAGAGEANSSVAPSKAMHR